MAGIPYRLVGGAARPDAITGLNPAFMQAMTQLYAAAPPEVQRELGLTSAYRSPAVQQALWDKSDKTGHTVAAPGKSRHNHGTAADLAGFGVGEGGVSPATKAWVHGNAAQFGLEFPMDYEPWHIQLAGNVPAGGGGGAPALGTTLAAAVDPRMAALQIGQTDPWKNFTNDVAQRRGGSFTGERSAGGSLSASADSDPGIPPLETASALVPPAGPMGGPMPRPRPTASPEALASLFRVKEVGSAANRSSERVAGQAKRLTPRRRSA
jgi:hypothetical protein